MESGAIQSIGSAAILLTTVFLARIAGPTVQGEFGLVRAELDLLTALCLLGIPQAAFYFSHRGELSVSAGKRIALLQAAVAASGVFAWRIIDAATGPQAEGGLLQAASYAVAVFCMVAYALIRSLALAHRSPRIFAVFSALPSALLLVSVLAAFGFLSNWKASATTISLLFAASYGLCVALGYQGLLPTPRLPRNSIPHHLSCALLRYGAATWIASICQAASVFLILRWIKGHNGVESAGVFAAGLALVTLAVTPVNLVVPVLFKRWTGMSTSLQRRELAELAAIVMAVALGALGTLLAWGEQVVEFIFGAQYAPSADIFALLCLGIIPQGFFRLWGVQFNALGRPQVAVAIELSRLVILATGLLIVGKSLEFIIWVWLGSELCVLGAGAAAYIWYSMRAGHGSLESGRSSDA